MGEIYHDISLNPLVGSKKRVIKRRGHFITTTGHVK